MFFCMVILPFKYLPFVALIFMLMYWRRVDKIKKAVLPKAA